MSNMTKTTLTLINNAVIKVSRTRGSFRSSGSFHDVVDEMEKSDTDRRLQGTFYSADAEVTSPTVRCFINNLFN